MPPITFEPMTRTGSNKPMIAGMTALSAGASVLSFSGILENSTKAGGKSSIVFGSLFAAFTAMGVWLLMQPEQSDAAKAVQALNR